MKSITTLLLTMLLGTCLHSQDVKILEIGDTAYTIVDANFELLNAAANGDTMLIRGLLAIGTDVDTRSLDGVTPLMYAAQNGQLAAVELLIDKGADISLKPYNHIDALLGACIAGEVLVADTLILNGADVNTRSLDGLTPLMYAAAYDYYLLADVLLFYGAGVNYADNFRNTALHIAAFYGNTDIAQLLVENGADIEAADYYGFTPLMTAAQNGHLETADFLVKAGCDINKTNNDNYDALGMAVVNRYYGVADYLLQHGADVSHKFSDKLNQYELARITAGREMTSLLEVYGAKPLSRFSLSKFITSAEMNWNEDDMMVGGSMGFVESVMGWEAELGYLTRPMVRSIRYDIDKQSQYQFWEKRSLIYLGAGKRFLIASPQAKELLAAYVNACAGYTYGSFRGASKKPDDHIVFIPKAGILYQYKALNVKLGYEYFNIPGSDFSPHRLTLSVGAVMNLIRLGYKMKKEPRL